MWGRFTESEAFAALSGAAFLFTENLAPAALALFAVWFTRSATAAERRAADAEVGPLGVLAELERPAPLAPLPVAPEEDAEDDVAVEASAPRSTSSSSFIRRLSSCASLKPAISARSPSGTASSCTAFFCSRSKMNCKASSIVCSRAPSLLFIDRIASRSSNRSISAWTSMDFCSKAFMLSSSASFSFSAFNWDSTMSASFHAS
mmetsp:Transcript_121406/g.259221  ORF Transcript_121406/g.259221 Transcript_121406/m.259221 type:complete len:204 (-) Transcript_121406:491-1102(-)